MIEFQISFPSPQGTTAEARMELKEEEIILKPCMFRKIFGNML